MYADEHRLALNLDIDRIRSFIGRWHEDPQTAGLLARAIALAAAFREIAESVTIARTPPRTRALTATRRSGVTVLAECIRNVSTVVRGPLIGEGHGTQRAPPPPPGRAIMHPMFVKLFIETDADDLLAEEEAKRQRAPVPAQSAGRSREGRLP